MDRKPGWNRLEAVIRSKNIEFTINGARAGVFPRVSSDGFGQFIMGSGLPNNRAGGNGISFIDNIYLVKES